MYVKNTILVFVDTKTRQNVVGEIDLDIAQRTAMDTNNWQIVHRMKMCPLELYYMLVMQQV